MYEGAIIALNKLRKQGVSVNLSVFDTETTDIETILRSPAINKADLIIGPVYQEDFITVASFAKERGIKIVSPLTPIDSSLYECSNVFQVPTDFNIQSENLLTHPQINAERSNIILISQQGNEESKEMHRLYRQFLPKLDTVFYRNNFTAEKDSTSFMDSLYTIYMEREHNPVVKRISYRIGLQPRDNHVTFLEVFDPRIINRVIVASEDEPFVSEVIANLKAFSDRYKSRVTVYGTNKWRRFENVEISNYYYLKLHLAAPYYVNYDSENVIDFIKEYRGKYKTEPSQFAFQGYDVMYYFTTAIYNYGVEFTPCLQNINVELLQSRYKFSPKQTDGAYENKDCFLLRYNAATMEITPYK
jgi:hypothetical protein